MAEARSEDQIKKDFPTYAWLLNDPEVKAVLSNPDISTQPQLLAAIQNTNWWKTTAPALRTYEGLQHGDPAALSQNLGQAAADIYDQYTSMGLKPDPAYVNTLADQSIKFGWTKQQINDAIASHASFDPNVLGQVGSIQTTAQKLKQFAADNYVSLDDGTAFTFAKQVASGEKAVEDFTPMISQWAQSKFSYSPEVQDAIKQGVTVKDYFKPYQTEAANLLEVSPESIDLAGNPQWTKVLDNVDDKGVRRPMTISEMQTYVRGMDQWKSTRQGQQSAADMGETLLKTFGKVAA